MATTRRASSRRRTSVQDDVAHLAALGHEQELKRNFSFLSMLGLAFAILNSVSRLLKKHSRLFSLGAFTLQRTKE